MHPVLSLIRDSRTGDDRSASVLGLVETLDDDLLAFLLLSDRDSPPANAAPATPLSEARQTIIARALPLRPRTLEVCGAGIGLHRPSHAGEFTATR